jgi:O-acetylserine/cysteine efflux transporter
MNTSRRHAIAALTGAGLLWGTTVPLSKVALEWLAPGWLTAIRFGLAAAVLLAVVVKTRRGLRSAFTPAVLASGAVGYGGSVILQNAGIARTSVTHAALLIGAVPVLVAVIAALWQHTVARPVAWAGFALSLAGVGLVTAGGGGGGATLGGDGLVLASLLVSATFTVGQARLLPGRDPVAVTAVQFLGAVMGALAFTVTTEGVPAVPASPGPVLAVVALTMGGTLLPFTLFAYGQSRVSAEIAGAFLNLEPLVGAVAGAVAFGDPVGPAQIAGGAAILAGIGLSSLPLIAVRPAPVPAEGRRGEVAGRQLDGARTGDRDAEAVVDRERDQLVFGLAGVHGVQPLTQRGPVVPLVQLVRVDGVGARAAEAGLAAGDEVGPRRPRIVRAAAQAHPDLGGHQYPVPAAAQGLELLGQAA